MGGDKDEDEDIGCATDDDDTVVAVAVAETNFKQACRALTILCQCRNHPR